MARADLLTNLVNFGINGDRVRFIKVVETIIAEERAKQHTILAEKLEKYLRSTSQNDTPARRIISTSSKIDNLINEVTPQKQFSDLILQKDLRRVCEELIQEHHRTDLLRSYNLEPRNKVLLIGPPGNGKTSLAEAIADALLVPLLVVRYEGIVGTYLGETANRLRMLIDYACTRKCVLFFDEFETLGKERGDTHETGEIKRVVSSLLMQIDSLPSHVVVIGATNHPELLDRAVWRRFQVRMKLPEPSKVGIEEWLERFQKRIKIDLNIETSKIAEQLVGHNYAEIEEFGTAIYRQYILNLPNANIKKIVTKNLEHFKDISVKAQHSLEGD